MLSTMNYDRVRSTAPFLEMRSTNCDRRHSVDVRTNVTSSSFHHKTPLILIDTRDTCLCLRRKKNIDGSSDSGAYGFQISITHAREN